MNVALVILHADPARGGAERYTVDLAGALARRGHGVSLAAGSFPAGGVPEGVRAVELAAGGYTRLGRYRRFLEALDAQLADGGRRRRYDVVHAMLPVRSCDLYHPHAGLAAEAVEAGHLKHEPGVVREAARWVNRVNRKRRAFAAVERGLLEGEHGARPPVVLCLSEYVKQTIRRHYPRLPEDRLATLFNAVDLRRFDPGREPGAGVELRQRLGIAPDRVVALMIAQDFARKGLRQAILATARVRTPSLTLLVVGKEDTSAYARVAREAGVADRVVFAGPTPDPYPFYRAADLFVLPTRHDPCSLVVLEALAMGVPVVSTTSNGACEVMTDGVHGRVLTDPGDVGRLAAAMHHLLDETTRRASGEACLGLRPVLSYDAHVERLESIYRDAARGA